MFLVYFDNKMSEMCDEFYNKERELKKDKKYNELRQAKADAMKNGVFRNHRFNFVINGIVERQMIDLNICQTSDVDKLDWITKHEHLKISYELPKDKDGDVKERSYSLNCLMNCLRGAIAHKMDHSYDIILNFNEEYPQIIDFLFYRRNLLSIEYDKVIGEKDIWVQRYFNQKNDQVARSVKKYIRTEKVDSKNGALLNEAL